MAYDFKNLSRQSDAMNTGQASGVGGLAMFTYKTTADTGATVSAANYFASEAYNLSAQDLIFCEASDGFLSLQVDAVDRTAGTVDTVTTGLSGVIETADLVNNAVTMPKMADNMLQSTTTAVSSAQILGMSATPVLLVAAPGAGLAHLIENVFYDFTWVAAQYVNGGAVAPEYGNAPLLAGVQAAEAIGGVAFAGLAADSLLKKLGVVSSGALTSVENQGLYLSNDTAPFITGDSTMSVIVYYKTVATS